VKKRRLAGVREEVAKRGADNHAKFGIWIMTVGGIGMKGKLLYTEGEGNGNSLLPPLLVQKLATAFMPA
jgi:hypothetical protein